MKSWHLYIVFLSILFPNVICTQDKIANLPGFEYKKFKQFLLNISKDDLKIQQNKMSKEFSEWKRDFEQIDDVCVMGVRI